MNKAIALVKDRRRLLAALALGGAAIIFLPYCALHKVCAVPMLEKLVRPEIVIQLPKGEVYAEVVDTQAAREKGLSGRSALDDDEGMLFVFDHPGKYGFWMKDMEFPIDMVWIGTDGYVVHVERNVDPASYTEHDPPITFINDLDALYVLELASGQADKHGLYMGVKLDLKDE